MSHEIRADYTQTLMFPPCVEDWVPCNHPARFIREVVDAMDLEKMGFRISAGEEGRPHYAEDMLLKVWLYGYCNRIRSTRGLEKGCMENLSLIWLTGNNAPDHNTLWRFYRDNKKAIREVFKHSVRIGMEANLVGMVLHAIDGTKIHSAATGRTALSKRQLEKALKKLDEGIEDIEKEVERARFEEGQNGWALPQELSDARTLREAVLAGLEILREEDVKSLSVADPQARVMKTPEGKRLGFNAQAVADDESGMIVANDVAAEKADEFHIVNFKRDAESGEVTCPMGRTLDFERERHAKSGNCVVRVYRCKHGAQCERAAECAKDKRGRAVEMSPWQESTQKQIKKQQDPDKRCKLKRRSKIIEPVFASIKERFGFRRFTAHGLENAKTQWSLARTAYNLAKLYKQWACGNLKITADTP